VSAPGTRDPGGARRVPPECVRLAETLRELRAATGLSLAGLAARTPYSKSSWERYLNGRTVPPRQAVEQLCELAGKSPQRPLALWELAEAAWSGRAGQGKQGDSEGIVRPWEAVRPTGPAKARSRLPWLYTGILGAVAALAVGTLIAVSRSGDGAEATPEDRTSTADLTVTGPGCHAASCTGKDPEDQDCSTAARPPVSLGERRFDDTVVKVRHSEVCDTVWARIDRGVVGDRVAILVPGVRMQQVGVQDQFDEMASLSTPMAVAGEEVLGRVRACLVREDERRCFAVTLG
jgi:transcriptional regulator with XRE-family HTH domain